jgi:putative FmdB family regulatory protein
MPLYEYQCANCGPFTELRAMKDRNAPADCPSCAQAGERMISLPSLRQVSAATRQAHSRNERSAHEPRLVRRESAPSPAGHGHGPGCGHAGHGIGGGRPWMLGH